MGMENVNPPGPADDTMAAYYRDQYLMEEDWDPIGDQVTRSLQAH